MSSREVLIGFALAFSFATSAYACIGSNEFSSPDGVVVAHITERTGTGCGESRVEMFTRKHHRLAARSYMSNDKEHGLGVEEASWTPNSAFFIFSMSSSGGHQANHYPIWYYSRRNNKFVSLEALLSGLYVTDAKFRIIAPATIEIIGRDNETRRVNLQPSRSR